MQLVVRTQPGQPNATAHWQGQSFPCLVGRNGPIAAELKREGDGHTPQGTWPLVRGLFRPDRVTAPLNPPVPWAPLTPSMGWCDAPNDALYNQPCPQGYPASHEALWRDDTAYDYVGVLDYNLHPVVPHAGSAIFLHVWHPGSTVTQGCVALNVNDLTPMLSHITTLVVQ